MLIPTDQIDSVKSLLHELGVRWSSILEPNPVQPICKGLFRGHIIAVYQDHADDIISEVKCLDTYSSEFEELLKSFMTPVEDEKEKES